MTYNWRYPSRGFKSDVRKMLLALDHYWDIERGRGIDCFSTRMDAEEEWWMAYEHRRQLVEEHLRGEE